jgi:YidC/Oxa1 family membrane protein insertase
MMEDPAGSQVLRALIEAGFVTVLRLHPMTLRQRSDFPQQLQAAFADQPHFQLDLNMSATDAWLRSNLMVSDWSGASTEYAFALEKPVVFIDTPQKIRNPHWSAVGRPGFEKSIRGEVGVILATHELERLPSVVEDLASSPGFGPRIRDARDRWISNVGQAAAVISRRVMA